MLLNGNAVQLSKSYAKNTHSTTDYQKNFAALYRATPCAQSSADRDRSGCDEMPYIPMPEGRGFTAYLVNTPNLRPLPEKTAIPCGVPIIARCIIFPNKAERLMCGNLLWQIPRSQLK